MKIALLVATFMLTASVVSASSINGDYYGYPIVKLTTGFGATEINTETPAILIDGVVMVPSTALEEMGATVRWNEETYTARINIPKKATNPNIDLLFLAKLFEDHSVTHIEYLAKTENFTRLKMYYKGSFLDESFKSKDFKDILFLSTLTDAAVIDIEDKDSSSIWTYSNFVKDYIYENITFEEFQKNLRISVAPVVTTPSVAAAPSSNAVIESRIDGNFEGWEGETIFKLQNGQIWQQDSYAYKYVYKYSPKVMIYKSGSRYKMKVDGVDGEIYVKRLK